MSEKPKPEINLKDDVQVIRNILLGEYLEKFQSQVAALEKEIKDLKRENKILLQDLKAANDKHFEEVNSLVDHAKSEQTESDKKLRRDYDAQLRDIDGKLKELTNRIKGFEEKQDGLFSSLASVLMGHKDKTGK